MIDPVILQRLYPAASADIRNAFAAQAEAVFADFGISDGRNRLYFFLAQIGHESNGLSLTTENLNYSAARLMQVWPKRFPNAAATTGFANNPEALANQVYGGRLGNTAPGDGWLYRGRGFIQVTGKEGYDEVGKIAGLDLLSQPDLASAPDSALRVAGAVWRWKNLNPLCDQGDFVGVSKGINGGTVGLQDRYRWLTLVQDTVPWPPIMQTSPDFEASLPVARIKAVQLKLQSLGLYSGSIDGVLGTMSRTALKTYQAEQNLPSTGAISAETLAAMKV